jgi:hypothetical protein
MVGASREAVTDFEFLRRRQNETVVKELCVASATASKTFRFKIPYKMAGHTLLRTAYIGPTGIYSTRNFTRLSEAVTSFAHLYANGVTKVTYLSTLTGCRSIT